MFCQTGKVRALEHLFEMLVDLDEDQRTESESELLARKELIGEVLKQILVWATYAD